MLIGLLVAGALAFDAPAYAQSSPAGTVMQAQTGNLIVIPQNSYYWDFARVVTTLPTDSTPNFFYDVRAMAYVTGAQGETTCRVGLSADTAPSHEPLLLSPVVDIPANTTIAIPLEYVGQAFSGQKLTLSLQFVSGPAPLNIEQWTSVTAEIVPTE